MDFPVGQASGAPHCGVTLSLDVHSAFSTFALPSALMEPPNGVFGSVLNLDYVCLELSHREKAWVGHFCRLWDSRRTHLMTTGATGSHWGQIVLSWGGSGACWFPNI